VSPAHGRPTISGWAVAAVSLAIASIPIACVLGVFWGFNVGMFISIILIVAGILLGVIAAFSIGKNPRNHGGNGLATIGFFTSIVVLLIVILLPSLSRAREGSHRACLSNLKSLGLASYMYQNDYNGYLPAAGSATPAYNDWVYWQCSSPYGNWPADNARDINKGMLVPYMGKIFTDKPYTCPQDTTCWPKRSGTTYQFSYTANANVFISENTTAPGIPNQPFRYASVAHPADKIMLVEEESASIDDAAWVPQNWKAGSTRNVLSDRHDKTASTAKPNAGRTNVAFMDSHVEAISRADALTAHFYDPLAP